MKFKQFLESQRKNENVWFHGDPNKRDGFCDQKMDRDAFIQDANANGPGIYFTDDYQQARGYAEPDGYVYTCHINPDAGIIITEDDTTSGNEQLVFELLKKAQAHDPESVYYAVTDYLSDRADELTDVDKVTDEHLKYIIYDSWSNIDLIGSVVMAYKEFFGRDANAWAKAMTDVGFLGFIQKQPEATHFIVYDCNAIKILKEEKYEEDLNEARKVRIFRAQPTGTNIIRKDDYVTMSVKFAVEHAENNHIYEDEPHDVVVAEVEADDIRDATNASEYLANRDIEATPIYTSKGYEYEGWEDVRNDKKLRRFIRMKDWR